MTVRDVASYPRVHPMTIYRLITRRDVPAIRAGRASVGSLEETGVLFLTEN